MTGSTPELRRVVVLFTRDLRLHDNPVLDLACRQAAEVIPVLVLDPALTLVAPNRASFLLDCLTDLRTGLRQRGGDLLIRRGDPVAQVIRLAGSARAEGIIMAADVSRYARRRHQRLAAACQQHRLALREAAALTVVPPGALVPSDGDHYRVFTPYWRAWSAYRWRQPLPAPSHVAATSGADPGVLPRREHLTRGPLAASRRPGGETAARGRMARWLDTGLAGYPGRHDDLAGAATSGLSADLHFGTISPLELAVAATGRPGGEAYVRQLCWRDFYAQVTAAFPDIATRDYRPRRDDWRHDPQSYQAWCAGQTGIPIIDAGMRQLAAEGFMHNRARMPRAGTQSAACGKGPNDAGWNGSQVFLPAHPHEAEPAGDGREVGRRRKGRWTNTATVARGVDRLLRPRPRRRTADRGQPAGSRLPGGRRHRLGSSQRSGPRRRDPCRADSHRHRAEPAARRRYRR
jgi:deoxyribodipyrimidine photo-lyase